MAGPSKGPRPLVVAAVVNYNRSDLTLSTLTEIAQLAQSRAEVRAVVVDNNSTATDLDRLTLLMSDAMTLIRLPANLGYGAAANVAAAWATEVKADYLWVLNNDVMLPPDSLDGLVNVIESDDRFAAVAPAILSLGARPHVLSAGVDVDLWRGRARHRLQGQTPDQLPSTAYEVDALEGSALLIRLSALHRVGGFDAGFFMYWEDTEWSCRARRARQRLAIAPSVRVGHALGQSSEAGWRIELMIRNRVRFMRIVGSPAQQITFGVYFLLGWLPAYFVGRLVPELGWKASLALVTRAVGWNLVGAVRSRRWRITRSDQETDIPPLPTPSTLDLAG